MNLQNSLTIARRELNAYFNSAIAYMFIIVFILITVGLFMSEFFLAGRSDMRAFFNALPIVLCAFLPALTMRLWAEDRRGNTLELLLTFPMRTHELVMGKFLASLAFFFLTLLFTFPIVIMIFFLGKPDFGPIVGSYVGCLLFGSFFISIGLFISGLCKDQIVAFISSLVICFLFVFVGTDFFAMSLDGWFPKLGLGSFLKNSFGVLPYYGSFIKGVINFSDLLYFVVGTTIFLALNGFWLEGRLRPKAKTIFSSAVGICFAIFIAFNWFVGDLAIARIDLTSQKIYTISNSSKKILSGLKVPAIVKLYISPKEKMPTQMKPLEQEIIDQLQEFKMASNGKLDFKIFHMDPTNLENVTKEKGPDEAQTLEEEVLKKGIEPFRVQSIEEDEIGVRLVYAALTIAYKEKPEEVIPQVVPQTVTELEYLIVSKIYRMTLEKAPKIALVAPYQDRSMDPMVMSVLQQLGGGEVPEQYREDEFKVLPAALDYSGYENSRIRLSKNEPIPEETTTLAIINPKELSERQRYEINRFLYEGGSVLLGVQNYEFEYRPRGRSGITIHGMPENPDVNKLLEPWGVQVDEQLLLDEQSEVISVGGGQMGIIPVSIPIKTPLHILLTQSEMNESVSITSNLSPLFYLWGSALALDEGKIKSLNLKNDVLLHSTKNSWKISFGSGTFTPQDFVIDKKKFGGPYPLSVFMSGQFPNNYADRKTMPLWPEDAPPQAEGTEPDLKELEKKAVPAPTLSPQPGKLLVVGSSVIFKENLMSGSGGHLNFFLNAVDALSLGEELIQIRSKREIDRHIRRVGKAENIWWRFFTIFFVPIAITIFGSMRLLYRQRSKQIYLKSLS